MNLQLSKYLQFATLIIVFIGCSHGPVKTKKEALIKPKKDVRYEDHLEIKSLQSALKNTIKQLELTATDELIDYPVSFSMNEYLIFLKHLNMCARTNSEFINRVNEVFSPYITFGKDQFGEILLTSYYEPLINGSLKKTKKYSTPLYKIPPNLVEVKLSQFEEALYGPIDTSRKVISAQLITDNYGNKIVTPLPSRRAIDFEGALANQKLEIVYVDPIEAFFLHIQGSGRVILPNGKSFTVGYHAQNGMKYEPIGKFLKDDIPKEKMSLQSIEEVLRTKFNNKLEEILPLNPSYIFFKKIEGRARTTLGSEVTDRRTLAVDTGFFNLGLLGHLDYPKLDITDDGAVEGEERIQHFVINQDTGGAIKTTGRADLFWGSGEQGKKVAGHMRHMAKLTYFLPKQDALDRIRSGKQLACQ